MASVDQQRANNRLWSTVCVCVCVFVSPRWGARENKKRRLETCRSGIRREGCRVVVWLYGFLLSVLSFDVLGPRISLFTILYLLLSFASLLWPIRFFLLATKKEWNEIFMSIASTHERSIRPPYPLPPWWTPSFWLVSTDYGSWTRPPSFEAWQICSHISTPFAGKVWYCNKKFNNL